MELRADDRVVLGFQGSDEGHRFSAVVRHVADGSQVPEGLQALIGLQFVGIQTEVMRVVSKAVALKLVSGLAKFTIQQGVFRFLSEMQREADVFSHNSI